MSNIYENIRKRREELGLSQEELASRMGYRSRSSINKIESGANDIPQSKITAFARALHTTPAYLLGLEDQEGTPSNVGLYPIGEMISIPLIASVRAGFDGLAVELSGEALTLPKSMIGKRDPSLIRSLRVVGNSMYPKICDGDRVLVLLQSSVDSGDVAVIVYNGDEATIKQVRYEPGCDWLELIPANPEYMTRRIEGEDLTRCHIVGKVITLIRDF